MKFNKTNSMDSKTVAEIIDEIISNSCVNDATTSQPNANGHPFHSYNEIERLMTEEKFECDVQSESETCEAMQQDDYSYFDGESYTFNHETFESGGPGIDDAPIMDEKVVDVSSDTNPKFMTSDAEPLQSRPHSFGSDPLRSKGFGVSIFGYFRVVANLPLISLGNSVSQYEILCQFFPPKMLEDELLPMFMQFGEVLKLVKNTTSNQLYVTYTNAKDAEKAIASLHGRYVQGQRVRIDKHLQNRQLVVRDIPKYATKGDMFRRLGSFGGDLRSVTLYNDPLDESKNTGVCFLEYPDHVMASRALKVLATKQLFGKNIIVEWPDRRFEWMEDPDTLYISNLRTSVNTRNLKEIFLRYGKVVAFKRSASGNFAKIQFQNIEDAKRAASEVDRSLLGNENLEIGFKRLTTPLNKPATDWINEFGKPVAKTAIDNSRRNDENVKVSFTKRSPERKDAKIEPIQSDTLYIDNLSPTLTAPDLRRIFTFYGLVLDVDINRTDNCASVRFEHPELAKRARCIDKTQLGVNIHISLDKRSIDRQKEGKPFDTIHLRQLRSNVSVPELRKCFSDYVEVMEIDKNDDSASIRFRVPDNAKRAAHIPIDKYRGLLGDRVQIAFDHDQSKREVQQKRATITETSNALYIYNMYDDMTTRRLRQLFTFYGDVMEIEKCANSAIVTFRNRDDSKRAAGDINRKHLGNMNPEILFYPKGR